MESQFSRRDKVSATSLGALASHSSWASVFSFFWGKIERWHRKSTGNPTKLVKILSVTENQGPIKIRVEFPKMMLFWVEVDFRSPYGTWRRLNGSNLQLAHVTRPCFWPVAESLLNWKVSGFFKRSSDFPLYWLFNRDSDNGFIPIPT